MLKVVRVAATYSYQRASRLARGSNVNQAVNGARPNPAFANIVNVVSDAASRQHQLQVDANINRALPRRLTVTGRRRRPVFANYHSRHQCTDGRSASAHEVGTNGDRRMGRAPAADIIMLAFWPGPDAADIRTSTSTS
jgi:hypothetical protein